MYEAPKLTELGTLAELTLTNITKNPGSGDVIIIGGNSQPAPGNGVISIS